ncbi:MAG: hypothetical protein M3P83_00565, partial [Actinomycetota bacterium]|nr:hypothetical protein [Actinomycetota bacterium]
MLGLGGGGGSARADAAARFHCSPDGPFGPGYTWDNLAGAVDVPRRNRITPTANRRRRWYLPAARSAGTRSTLNGERRTCLPRGNPARSG